MAGDSEVYPRGHYYSPLPDLNEVKVRAAELFREDVDLSPSIDVKAESQRQLINELASYYTDFQWPNQETEGFRFHLGQDFYGCGDAIMLHAMLRRERPKRVIEAGSGFTSALMLDVNERFFHNQTQFTFIEPFPDRLLSLLRAHDIEKNVVLRKKLQEVSLETFEQLAPGDIFFVDSSHVAKVGSDVNYILFEILPSLKPGVLIHFHDIFWPFQYRLRWILQGKAWNEAYLLRAFLQYNSRFEIILFNSFVAYAFRPILADIMPNFLSNPGGSLWLRKLG